MTLEEALSAVPENIYFLKQQLLQLKTPKNKRSVCFSVVLSWSSCLKKNFRGQLTVPPENMHRFDFDEMVHTVYFIANIR